jgi:hypothetical protein
MFAASRIAEAFDPLLHQLTWSVGNVTVSEPVTVVAVMSPRPSIPQVTAEFSSLL